MFTKQKVERFVLEVFNNNNNNNKTKSMKLMHDLKIISQIALIKLTREFFFFFFSNFHHIKEFLIFFLIRSQ